MNLEIRTLRSENFEVRLKRWWIPLDRRAARLTLKLLEGQKDEISKRVVRELFFGVREDWKA